MLTTDSGMHLQLPVDEPRKLIGFIATYALQTEAPLADKLAFMNRVNDRVVVVRFSLLGEDTLYVDHQLPFDGGVTAAAVIGCARRMGRITPQAILDFSPAGLMR